MKRLLCLLPLLGCLIWPATSPAQNLVNDATRQELEDRLRRAERDLEALKESNESLRRKLTALDAALNEISRLSAERDRANNNILKLTASKEELHQLEKALKESEHRRDADKKLFLEKFEELRKVIAAAPAAPAFTPPVSKPGKERGSLRVPARRAAPPMFRTPAFITRSGRTRPRSKSSRPTTTIRRSRAMPARSLFASWKPPIPGPT
jgi:hypothetical protein